MKVLMVSTDRAICVSNSAVSERMKEYGGLVEELHIVLLSDKRHGLKEGKLSNNVWVYPTNSLNRFLRSLDAARIGKKIKADLITTQDPFECGWVGVKLKEIKKIPLEVQLHTDPFSPQFFGTLNLFRKFLMRGVLKKTDGVRVVLRSVGEEIKKRFDVKNVYTLPIFINQSRFSNLPSFNLKERYGFNRVCLMVSRLTEEKNISLALEAFKIVRKKLPGVGLVVVGDGPEKFSSQEGVVFVGWQEDLSTFYKGADVFVQTSLFEGYGLSLVEAGLSGLPVVSTPVGIANELKNVSLACTKEEFAKAIGFVLDNPQTGLKQELESSVLSKDQYLSELKNNWQNLVKK